MKTKLFIISGVVVIALASVSAYLFWTKSQDAGLVRESSPERILNYAKELKSPLLLVNFWASWCEPCKEEFPHILNLRKKYAEKGLQVVFISVDDRDDRSAAETFLRDQGVDFPSFIKGKQPMSFVSKIFPQWSGAVPASIIFDKDMKIVEAWEGDASFEEFETRVKKHL